MPTPGLYGPEVVLNGQSLTPIAMPSASITVRNTDGSAAVLYTDSTGSTTTSNVVSTNTRGELSFYALPGYYDIVYTDIIGARTLRVEVDESSAHGNATYPTYAGRLFNVALYGAVGNGSTDDTAAVQAAITAAAAAGGGVVWFPTGVYVIAGALQDTGGANAQLLLPSIDYVDTKQVTIEFRGPLVAPPIMSVIGTTPLPVDGAILKSTLNAGVGGAMIGGYGPAGTFANFTNVLFRSDGVSYRMPSNPVLTALNLSKVGAVDLANMVVDVGTYFVGGIASAPTTATSCAIRCPASDNAAFTRLRGINVIGFYTGYQLAEHTDAGGIAAWACVRGIEFATAANHASHLGRILIVHCPTGLVWTGNHRVTIAHYDNEHSTGGSWRDTVADIATATDGWAQGSLRYATVTGGVGPGGAFTRTNATGVWCQPLHTSFCRAAAAAGSTATTAATHTAVPLVEVNDIDNLHSDSTNPSRFTIAETGWYRVTGQAAFASQASGFVFAAVWKNGVSTGSKLAVAESPANAGDATVLSLSASTPTYLGVGDYIQLGVYTSIAGAYVGGGDGTLLGLERLG